MKYFRFFLAITPLSFLTILLASASDHIDGPVTMKHRVADLTDLFAFPTPQKPGFLTVILNAYPIIPKSGHFDSKVSYQITIRKASIVDSGLRMAIETEANSAVTIRCSFETPHEHNNHKATCKASNGFEAKSIFNQETGNQDREDFRLFTGMRLDPFFFNSDWATAASTKAKLLRPNNSDTMAQINMLSIVMELDMSKMLPNQNIFAIVAEAFAQNMPTAPIRRMDRVGRPEITNVSLIPHNDSIADLRDLYNLDAPFQVSEENQKKYRQHLDQKINYYDTLDGIPQWVDRDRNLLASLLVDDSLVVDISKPCDGDQFFAIERAILRRKAHTSCGGRKPTDDIMDTLFTLYIAGINGARIRDGVDQPSKPIRSSFPYLNPPDLSISADLKARAARHLLGL